jgi:hypothetical protein
VAAMEYTNGISNIVEDLSGRVISQAQVFDTADGQMLKITFVGGRVLDIRDKELFAQFR